MTTRPVVSREEWLTARKALLAREKAFTRERDALSAARRELPWERVEKDYVFEGADGRQTLAELFGPRSQLIVYHFMFGADWEAGCKSCSFWADNFDGVDVHLAHRDTALVAISSAPYATLAAYRARMGWRFRWLSAQGNTFNQNYQVTFSPEAMQSGVVTYNYRERKAFINELPGISVFAKDAGGAVFHTYSCYERGLDIVNGAYHLLDLTPKGRDESAEGSPMSWLRRRDEYAD